MLTPPKQITVKAVREYRIGGDTVPIGKVNTYDRVLAAELIANGKAVAHTPAATAPAPKDAETANGPSLARGPRLDPITDATPTTDKPKPGKGSKHAQ